MKKFLLLVLGLFFCINCADAATTFVSYNNAGAPLTIARGASRPVSASRVSDCPCTRYSRPSVPARPAMPYGYRTRNAHIPTALTNYNFPAPVQSASIPQISRFDKNNGAVIPKKSYTMNGVTYYN